MRAPDEIRELEFTKTPMGGYKQSEVEAFLEEMADDVANLIRFKTEAENKIKDLTEKLEQNKVSQDGLQKVLICAQRVSDEMTEEATKKAEEILVLAKREADGMIEAAQNTVAATEEKAKALGVAAEHEAAKIIADAVAKSEETVKAAEEKAAVITAAASKSVEEQQQAFNNLRIEIQNYKKAIALLCGQLGATIESFPEDIKVDAIDAAAVAEEKLEIAAEPEVAAEKPEIVEETPAEAEEVLETVEEIEQTTQEIAEETVPVEEETAPLEMEEDRAVWFDAEEAEEPAEEIVEEPDEQLTIGGFVLNTEGDEEDDEPRGRISFSVEDDDDEDEEDDDDERLPFFRKRRR